MFLYFTVFTVPFFILSFIKGMLRLLRLVNKLLSAAGNRTHVREFKVNVKTNQPGRVFKNRLRLCQEDKNTVGKSK